MFKFVSIAAPLLALISSTAVLSAEVSSEQQVPPKIMLWSWQKIEDLSRLDSRKVGVALLVGRFTVDANKIALEPRLAQLLLPSGCYREAVARVEMKQLPKEADIDSVSSKLADAIVHLALAHGRVDGLQVDFDAKQLERPFYVKLLKSLRSQLPPDLSLSMTALASWSQGDQWLRQAMAKDNLSIDFVVPMFFTMGVGKDKALHLLQESLPGPFNGRTALGLSLSESSTIKQISGKLRSLDRIYLFCSPGWRDDRLKTAGNLVGQNLLKERNNGI